MFTKILANDELLRYVPSIHANKPHHSVSSNYSFIPTIKVVDTIRETGWFPVQASEQKARTEENMGYQKHLIRFSRETDLKTPNRVEIVLVNSHNRTAAFRISIGIYRLVCSNGMIVGEEALKFKHKHIGFDLDAFMNSIEDLSTSASKIQDKIEDWNTVTLEPNERGIYAQKAIQGAYKLENIKDSIIDPDQVLLPRRRADIKNHDTLWKTYNIVQESLTKGGLKTSKRTKKGSVIKTRAIRNIDKDLRLNEMLWNLSEETYKKLA